MQRLLIEEIGVCLYRLSLGCRRCPVGFQLVAAYAALYRPRRHTARFLARKFYPVPAFHTDIFFLNLVDFPMYGAVQLLRRTGQGLCRNLPFGGLIRLFQRKGASLPLPFASSKTRSFLILVCLGIAARAASKRSAAFSDLRIDFCNSGVARSASENCKREVWVLAAPRQGLFPCALCRLPFNLCADTVNSLFCRCGRGLGIVFLLRPFADTRCFARREVFRNRPVAGHFLRYLVGGFPFLAQSSSPPIRCFARVQ